MINLNIQHTVYRVINIKNKTGVVDQVFCFQKAGQKYTINDV